MRDHAWKGYELVHGMVLINVPPPFTLATIIGVSITYVVSSLADDCCYGYFTVFISAWVKFKVQTACIKPVTPERFCLY